MKGMDRFLCSSSASTAIMDQRAIVRRAYKVPISDHVHVYPPRKNQPHLPLIPCSLDQLPIDPKPLYEKCRKSFSCNDRDELRRRSYARQIYDEQRRKSTSSGSSRFRTSDDSTVPFIDWLSKSDATLVPSDQQHVAAANPRMRLIMRSDDDECRRPSAAPLRSSSTGSRNQVVVLRVSVHCKGCEAKLRKHLSKIEGVTSFSIDIATKKVTVMGDVTPLGVLASVSKVKKAQLWSSPTSSSPSPSSRWSS